MTHIQIQQLSKRFGGHQALDQINLTIEPGEFIALVGPSGCGKSTLLRALAGLEQVDRGSIAFNGQPVTHLPPQRRQLAMVFQSYALYPHMTVHDNIAFGLRERGQRESEVRERVAKVVATLHLDGLLERYPRQLSGGQRQRVAMGRAMVREPVAFLFDEPLSNLDAQLRVQMRAEIRDLQQQLGVTTVYVTHDQEEAMTMADRIVVMRAGCIEQIDTPLALYDRPANAFVAQFIGSPPMNLLPLEWHGDASSVVGQTVHLGAQAQVAQAQKLGVRPEHLRLITPEEAEARRAPLLNVCVRAVDHLGSHTELHVHLEGAADAGGIEPPALLACIYGRHFAKPGERLSLSWSPQQAHLFNAQGIRHVA